MNQGLSLIVLSGELAACRLGPSESIPTWAVASSFYSVSRTSEELSVVCAQENVPEGVKAEREWKCIKVKGPLDFGLTGILASLAKPLADAGISLFAISTFDTDYLLVKSSNLSQALTTLEKAGHNIETSREVSL